jgi:hypothetical protein
LSKARDIAVVKTNGKNFRSLTLGNSDRLQVGEEVVAIGNPLSLESSVSNGIVSGIRTTKDGKFLQITAPISQGSSGGPLFNMAGEVVGITIGFLESGENLNFAVPINEAKPLLLTDSSRLQNLPNEDASAPTDPPPSTTGEGLIEHKKHTKDSYYVRARKNETYVIEYRGHQLTAHCREALGWSDMDKLGRPMTENECVYLSDKVGKHIAEDKMLRQNNELRYRPLANTDLKPQVADVLDITDDVLLGAPKHRHPAPKTSPDILRTLHWIQNTLNDWEGKTQNQGADGEIVNHINLMPEIDGCRVIFVYEQLKGRNVIYHIRHEVNLGDLDPSSLISDDSGGAPESTVRVHTTDKTPSVNMTADRGWEPATVFPETELVWDFPSPYAEWFVKALHRAITLCGGKASAF